jgi:hypothetical protein
MARSQTRESFDTFVLREARESLSQLKAQIDDYFTMKLAQEPEDNRLAIAELSVAVLDIYAHAKSELSQPPALLHGEAGALLEMTHKALKAARDGDVFTVKALQRKALEFSSHIATERTQNRLLPLARHGRKFRHGRRKGAADALGLTLLEILRDDPRMAAKDVHQRLIERAKQKGSVIVSVASDHVMWRDGAGLSRKTAWSSIRNRLTTLRHRLPAQS